jgi:translocation and assembly module TamA
VGNRELGSDLNIARFTANLRYIITPAPRHRLVSRAEFGVAEVGSDEREDLAPSLSFFAGGSHSIRGFSYQSLGNEIDITQTDGSTKTLVTGGDRLFTASVEYQYYFNEK